MQTSQDQGAAREANAFQPACSPAVLNIVSYRFGTQPEATRPDNVLRSPTVAVLLQNEGRLYEHLGPDRRTPLPNTALLGARATSHIWETDPGTEFTLINLAPGVASRLFGIDPRDIGEEIESLQGHPLSDRLLEHLLKGRLALHEFLCSLLKLRGGPCNDDQKAQFASSVLQRRSLGDRVGHYADQFGVTPRTLQRTIRAAVGLTPKQILAIERLRALVTLTAGGWRGSLAQLAQEGGFFDQSHLRHELLRYNFSDLGELAEGDHVVLRK